MLFHAAVTDNDRAEELCEALHCFVLSHKRNYRYQHFKKRFFLQGNFEIFIFSIYRLKNNEKISGKGVRENVGNVRQTGFMVVFMLEHDPIRFLLRHYDTMTNKQHEIVFLDTNNNFKHLIFICLSRHTVKKRITFYQFFLNI